MSFTLYQSLIRQLHRPEVIRLNYSGESLHYPQLREAVQLARETGATTEIVSALGSATYAAVESLVDSRLHRLSVSIHSMDTAQFRLIYGRGDISDLRDRLDHLQQYKRKHDSKYPEIDIAFVAMQDNLPQLRHVIEYARTVGATHVSIHPVIQRGVAPLQFPRELDNAGSLRAEFDAHLRKTVENLAAIHPEISITVARPEHLSPIPASGITTCEQNPWDTVHVLANGSVVVCEVQDRMEIGNLTEQTLSEIWHGSRYQEFRQQYITGKHASCAICPWRRTVALSGSAEVLIRGWHPSADETVRWSEASSAAAVVIQPGVTGIRLEGLLPPPPKGIARNTLSIYRGTASAVQVVNKTSELMPFQVLVPSEAHDAPHTAILRFETQHRFCPSERGLGLDLRNLGFAFTGLTLRSDESRGDKVHRLLDHLRRIERLAVLQATMRWRLPKSSVAPPGLGISVVVPARDTPDLLAPTLASARTALAQIHEPSELIVVVSGTQSGACADLRQSFPEALWLFQSRTLDFGSAVKLGLSHAKHPWLYLLNSDMRLHPNALTEVANLRAWDTFAVGSRIRMQDGSITETNWTDLSYPESDAAELIERDPATLREARGCLYVGGGSGLFRASLLRQFIKRTGAYAPFYWEDVEWGTLAWRYGYRCMFCPTSEAEHSHRQTILRYFPESEVSRIFERNRLLFHLRNLSGLHRLEKRLLSLDPQSWSEIWQPRALFETTLSRATAFIAPQKEEVLLDRWKLPTAAAHPHFRWSRPWAQR